MLLSLFLLLTGWILIWRDMPLPGVVLLALFAWHSWRRHLRGGDGASGSGGGWASSRASATAGWDWRSEPLPPTLFTTHPPSEERQIGGIGEIGMGGPIFWSQLLRDGALLDGVCSEVLDLDGGRLRLAQRRTRGGGTQLLAYDGERQLIHLLPVSANDTLLFEEAANRPTPALAAKVRQACLHSEHTQALHRVHGILVPASEPAPAPMLQHRLANGSLLEARLMLPEDVSRTPDPHGLLSLAPYALFLDGVDTGLHVTHLLNVQASPDGRAFCLPGLRLSGGRGVDGLWHLWLDGRWHVLRGYAKKTARATGSDYLFDLDVSPRDGGVFRGVLHAMVYGPAGPEAGPPAPSEIELCVSWSKHPLVLPTRDDAIELRPPAAGPAHQFSAQA